MNIHTDSAVNDQAARVIMYQEIMSVLRDWGVGGRGCEFGSASAGVISSQLPFTSFELLPYPEYDICNLHNLDTQWDFMLADQVLEHVRYPWRAVEEVRAHLRPGGIAVFTTPFLYRLHPSPKDYWRFTPDGMRVLCANYADVVVGQWGNQQIVSASLHTDPLATALYDRTNDPALPIVIWTLARTAGDARVAQGWSPEIPKDGADGGPWRVDDFKATGGESWLEQRVCDYLVTTYQPADALDLGCGAGRFVSYLSAKGVEAWGVEPANLKAIFPVPERFLQYDLRTPLDLGRKFDLVLCLEVAEHIDAEFEPVVFDTIKRHVGNYLLFSAATVGQGGHGHVNEHTEDYWFARLRERGLRLLVDQTNICRALCKYSWYAKNISLWIVDNTVNADPEPDHQPQLLTRPDTYALNLEEIQAYQQGQIAELERAKAWLEQQCANWQAEAERRADQLAGQQEWIAELERAKAWLEQQRANWQAEAERRADQLAGQQEWIAELERAKAWLEQQRANWQRLAEEHTQVLQSQELEIQALKATVTAWRQSRWVSIGAKLGMLPNGESQANDVGT